MYASNAILDNEELIADRWRAGWKHLFKPAAEHHLDQPIDLKGAGGYRRETVAVADDCDPMAEFEYLAETVSDINDRAAFLCQGADRRLNTVNLDLRQGGCRLI